jgi:Phytanoyl-CoA dioxygenase (PhyH)
VKPVHPNQALLPRMKEQGFWQALNPDLHITGRPLQDTPATCAMDADVRERCVSFFRQEGYFQAPPLIAESMTRRLARAVTGLADHGIPGVFAFIYDEFWQLFMAANPFLGSVLGSGYRVTPSEIWTFHVPMGSQSAGWAPHRDLLTHDTVRGENVTALTLWIPLTDATPLNGCMYVLPEKLDPGIGEKLLPPQPTLALLQNVRALPAAAGSVLGWNTRILHWGGRSSDQADQPRIAAGIYFHARDINLNALAYQNNEAARKQVPLTFERSMELPFDARLAAIGEALKTYESRSAHGYRPILEALQA